MYRLSISFILLLILGSASAQLQSPGEVLGYELGTYFSRHHQVVDYFDHLETNTDGMLKVEEYGRTNENRELILAYISSKKNMKRLDEIQAAHEKGETEEVAIVWLSYNVHGNEASGTEASMLTAYELLTKHTDWLENVLIIMDPCLNPDGRDRYVNWYNQKKNVEFDPHLSSSEHTEPWPAGRFNHYLYDLNRDWAWLDQVESQQRIAVYNKWLPHVHVDFHEQWFDAPYYFAPGAEPFHEVITDWQREFQLGLGRNHAEKFDAEGWLYYTRELFDLLYPGYGDTYPTFSGAIGMTYEQAGHGMAGLGIINKEGDTLTLKDRVTHHHTTGLSTVEYSVKNSGRLISEFQSFVSRQDFKYKTYALWGDREKMEPLLDLLKAHEIEFTNGNGQKISGFDYSKGSTGSTTTSTNHILISTEQRKGAFVNVLFEPTTLLSDSVTYDLTAWALPYAYGLDCIASESSVSGAKAEAPKLPRPNTTDKTYAYLIEWNSMSDARALSALLKADVRVRFAEKPFSFGDKKYAAGTLIIIKPENKKKDVDKLVRKVCADNNITFSISSTGMVDTGKDFGSHSVKKIKKQKVGLLTEEGQPERIGEVWHFFEQELNYPVQMINGKKLTPKILQSLDVLIVAAGSFNISDSLMATWVNEGGKLIVMGNAMRNFGPTSKFAVKSKIDPTKPDTTNKYANAHIKYSEKDRESAKKSIPGAIYKCKVENTNPLAFGYGETYFSLKVSSNAFKWLEKGENVVYLEDDGKPETGFAGHETTKHQKKSLIFGVEKKGAGSVIYMVDPPVFRGFWENGKLFLVNAVFFVNA